MMSDFDVVGSIFSNWAFDLSDISQVYLRTLLPEAGIDLSGRDNLPEAGISGRDK